MIGQSTYNYILETYDWIVRNITDSNRKNKAVINLSICMYSFPSSAAVTDIIC